MTLDQAQQNTSESEDKLADKIQQFSIMRTTLEDNAKDAKKRNNNLESVNVELKNNNAELINQITVITTEKQNAVEKLTQLETDVQTWKVK